MSPSTVQYANFDTANFRATLDRLPDEIALAIGLRVFDPTDGDYCVVGWSVREAIARVTAGAAEPLGADGGLPQQREEEAHAVILDRCTALFGGSKWDWDEIYYGVMDERAPLIEEALFDRVMAAATAKPSRRGGR